MKVLLDIEEKKAGFVMELLKSLSFVKATPLTEEKARFLKGFKESIDQANQHKQGKIKLKPARQLLNEL